MWTFFIVPIIYTNNNMVGPQHIMHTTTWGTLYKNKKIIVSLKDVTYQKYGGGVRGINWTDHTLSRNIIQLFATLIVLKFFQISTKNTFLDMEGWNLSPFLWKIFFFKDDNQTFWYFYNLLKICLNNYGWWVIIRL